MRSEASVCFDKAGCEAAWCGHVDNSLQGHESGDWTLDTGWFPVRTGSGVQGLSNIPLCPQQPGYKR